jgi:protein-S-isoprenylcysteine O-methyltransferase Ste14
MWRHPILKAVLLVYIGWGGWNWISNRPIHPPDGVRDDGMWIRTSLVRNDTGAGACEMLLVSDVTTLPQ